MGSSVLGAGAGWFWSRWGWSGVSSVALLVLAFVMVLALRVQWLATQVDKRADQA